MLKTTILTISLSFAALPALADSSTTSTSNGTGHAQNSLTLEGSTSSSVGVGNNTAPCQQVKGLALMGTSFSNSRTLDWCLSEQMAKTLVQVTRMKGEQRRVAIYTLCSKSKDYQDVLVGLGYCAIRKK
jgi:hypothetical protein